MASYIGPPQSGSIRSDTYSRNRYGQYIRNRSTPVNPKTAAQTLARTRFTVLSQGWRNLTSVQRTSWNAYAETHPIIDSLGNVKYLTGSAIYLKIGAQALNAGQTVSSTPPGEPAFVTGDITLVATAGTPSLTIAGVDQPSDYRAIVNASPQVSAGVSYPPRVKKIQSVAADSWSTPVTFLGNYNTAFGALIEGQKIIVRAQLVSDEGVYGPLIQKAVTVAA